MRIVAVLLLLVVALACGYGFLAAGEPGTAPGWRLGYGAAGALALAGATRLLATRRR